jgi:hypothetical protein
MALPRRFSRTTETRAGERGADHDATAWKHRALAAEAKARGRQVRATISSGALGGGMLLAGFGLIPGLIGMVLGGLLGYVFERSVDAERSNRTA